MLLDNFLLSISVVTPIFVFLALGMLIRRFAWLSQAAVSEMNKLIFKLFFPAILFNNIYSASLSSVSNVSFVVYMVIATCSVFIITWITATPFIKNPARRGAFVQGIFRHNSLLFSLAIIANIYGPSHTGLISIALAVVVPIYNILVVILLETLQSGTFKISKVTQGIIKNPLIIASGLGIVTLITNIHLPVPIEKVIGSLGNATTPLALMMLGATLDFSQIKKNNLILVMACFCKLIVVPALFVIPAYAVGFRGLELGCVLAMTAAPTAVSSFPMAQAMGADAELAGQIIVITSALSVFTLFLWIFTLSNLNLLF